LDELFRLPRGSPRCGVGGRGDVDLLRLPPTPSRARHPRCVGVRGAVAAPGRSPVGDGCRAASTARRRDRRPRRSARRVTRDGRPTPAGIEARDAIEFATDRLAAPLVATLGDRVVELVEAMRPLAERIMAAGEVPTRNNMGLPWPGASDGRAGA